MSILYAPWTQEQLKNITSWQINPTLHPYTCLCGKNLIPTNNGFVCVVCGRNQNWCHDFTANEDWSNYGEEWKI